MGPGSIYSWENLELIGKMKELGPLEIIRIFVFPIMFRPESQIPRLEFKRD